MGVLGRVYLASEGINAQVSIPKPRLKDFRSIADDIEYFNNVPFKYALENYNLHFTSLL